MPGNYNDTWNLVAHLKELPSLAVNTYWLSQCVDLIAGIEGTTLGVSNFGASVGISVALLATMSSFCMHSALNTYPPSSGNRHERLPSLNFLNYIPLLGNLIARTGEMAAPLSFVVNLATGGNLSHQSQLAIQGGGIFIGLMSALADTRNCKEALQRMNALDCGGGSSSPNSCAFFCCDSSSNCSGPNCSGQSNCDCDPASAKACCECLTCCSECVVGILGSLAK